jgi:hypothetical protein
MTRRRWIYIEGEAVEVTNDYVPDPVAPMVIGDLPSYQSPVTGLWVDGRAQRREDLKRTGSRPWEGLDQEKKEAARHNAYIEQKQDARLHHHAAETFYQLSPQKREILTKGSR